MNRNNPKTTCAAFGCKRWTRTLPHGYWYLCPDHWPQVPRRLRRLVNAANKKADRYPTNRNRARTARLARKCIEEVNRNVGI